MRENYPNEALIQTLLGIYQAQPETIIGFTNPALAKKARFTSLFEYLKVQKYDFVLLQELWNKNDYQEIKIELQDLYWISPFDENCNMFNNGPNGATLIECDGLTTLIKKESCSQPNVILDHTFELLPKFTAEDAAQETSFSNYFEFVFQRKVLKTDVLINGWIVRIFNTHLTPQADDAENYDIAQNREMREKQAQTICNAVKENPIYDLAILGLDANDIPGNLP